MPVRYEMRSSVSWDRLARCGWLFHLYSVESWVSSRPRSFACCAPLRCQMSASRLKARIAVGARSRRERAAATGASMDSAYSRFGVLVKIYLELEPSFDCAPAGAPLRMTPAALRASAQDDTVALPSA